MGGATWRGRVEGWATPLSSSATVPYPTGGAVQALEVVKNVNVTVPVGVPIRPRAVTLSHTVAPAVSATTTVWLASWISVGTVGVSSVTVSGSHGLSVAA